MRKFIMFITAVCVLFLNKSIFVQTSVKAGNDVIDILTSEDMENMPLESRM